jgi:hypothetical protein
MSRALRIALMLLFVFALTANAALAASATVVLNVEGMT